MSQDLSATSLKDAIAAFTTNMGKHAPPEVIATLGAEIEKLAESGIAKGALKSGAQAPSFSLPDTHDSMVALSSLLATGPVVVTFYRGGWCPFCNLALHHYQSELVPQLERYSATLAAISPQKPDESLSTAEKHALQYPVLSDAGARVARRLGIAFQPAADVLEAQRTLGVDIRDGNAEGTTELPMPTVLVVDRDRVVRFADVQPDYTSRTEVQDIISALAEL